MRDKLAWASMAVLAVLLMAAFAVAAQHHQDAKHLTVYQPYQGVLVQPTSSPTLIPPVTLAPVAETATPPPPPPAPTADGRIERLCAPERVQAATQSLAIIDDAQSIHAQWIEYIRDNLGGTPPPSVGDTAWHQKWVADYATVIGVLKMVLETCR